VKNDTSIIFSVYKIFSKIICEYPIPLLAKGKLTVQIANQLQDGNFFQNYSDKLSIDVQKEVKSGKRPKDFFFYEEKIFKKAVTNLYSDAVKNKKFTGADIWSFFKYDLDEKYIQEGYRNILLVLTDGYMIVEGRHLTDCEKNMCPFMTDKKLQLIRNQNNKWDDYIKSQNIGLLPVQNKLFSNLDVLVMEINPYQNSFTYEYQMLKKIWENWLGHMNLKKYEIQKSQNSSTNNQEIILKFLGLRNITGSGDRGTIDPNDLKNLQSHIDELIACQDQEKSKKADKILTAFSSNLKVLFYYTDFPGKKDTLSLKEYLSRLSGLTMSKSPIHIIKVEIIADPNYSDLLVLKEYKN
jgi:hypothetical protein